MGSWTSEAQRRLANRKEELEADEIENEYDYLYAAKDVSEALSYLQMGAGHHPEVKGDIDAAAEEISDILSRMSTWETMEEDQPIPESAKTDLRDLAERVLDLSMSYRSADFELESIQ